MESIGPAACLASSGSADTQAAEIGFATGLHSRCHVGSVFSTRSRGVHATVVDAPAGSVVPVPSHDAATCAASLPDDWLDCSGVLNPTVASPLPVRRCNAICLARS